VGALILVGAAVAVTAAGFGGTDSSTGATPNLPPGTTPVTKATLVQTESVNGTLGYGDETALASRGHGTLTWLPSAGSTVQRGQTVYTADNVAYTLWYGTLPFYRSLKSGDTGPDVKELEQNLKALGYTGFTVDETYNSSTATAVKKWQKATGLTQTGTFDNTSVVLAPAAFRVATIKAALGDPAGGALLTWTGTGRVVTVPLDVSKQSLVKVGIAATVTLPDGSTVDGQVSTVGTVATAGANGGSSTIPVTVTLADQSKLGTLDAAPVQVSLVSARAENVLTVPVEALLALAEGGYGLQIVEGSTTRYVAVKTGMFADGRVEISGTDIRAGIQVGVPS
jgi:peptidoglycan hydrolase-like protein with peptidoglycan-binding domain